MLIARPRLRLLAAALAVLTAQSAHAKGRASVAVGHPEPPAADLNLAPRGEQTASALAHLASAQLLEDSGKAREALEHYLAFVAAADADPDIVAHTADLALAYRGMDEALSLLESRTRAAAAPPQAWSDLTRFAVKHQAEKDTLAATALAAAAEMLHRFPRDAASYENAAALHLAQGHRDEASRIIDEAAKQDSTDPRFWLRTGRMAQEVWPIADAERRAINLEKINPFFEKARDLALEARDQEAILAAADFFLFSNQLAAAAEACEKALARGGGLAARSRLVRLYEAMEKPAESFRALEDLVKHHPNDVEHRRLLASQYLQKRDIENATRQLEAALQAGGGELQDYLQLCNLLRLGRDSERFLRFAQRASQLYPTEPRVTYFGALARSRMKQYAEAAAAFDQAAKQAAGRSPELLDDMFHFNHGVALERSGRFEEAAKKFEKSIQLTPQDDPARAAGTLNYLGYMWLERGQHLEQAEQFIRKANDLEPGNAAYVDSLGWVLFKRGKFAEALKELQRSESLLKEVEPDDAEILDHLAQTHDRLGQREKAEAYWRRVVDLNPQIPGLLERARQELKLDPPKPAPREEESPPAKKP